MAVDRQTLLQDLQARITDLLRNSPAADVERNLKALVAQAFQRLDLVTREELDATADLVAGLAARVARLEEALAAAETAMAGHALPAPAPGSAAAPALPSTPAPDADPRRDAALRPPPPPRP
jgi:hypothetical protein